MANVFDYLVRRGRIPIYYDGLQEADHLIFTRLSYIPFEWVIDSDEVLIVKEAYERFLTMDGVVATHEDDARLLQMMASSRRFGSLLLHSFSYSFDVDNEKQFAAIGIFIDLDLIYISYRGTDNTFVGWKEDFNMGFMKHVPSQLEAVSYLEMVAKKYDGNFIVGGHSKGGNLAVYASSFCDIEVQKRILAIYNFDGPGLSLDCTKEEGYLRVIDRIFTYIPQSSVIGLLLFYKNHYFVVFSHQIGILQHDLYSWQIDGTHFVFLSNVDVGSYFLSDTIHDWLDGLCVEKRKQFVDILFDILMSTGMVTVTQFQQNWLFSAIMVVRKYQGLTDDEKKVMMEVLWSLEKVLRSRFINL